MILTTIQWQAGIGSVELRYGRLAQLGERRVRNAEVEGSNPLPSTMAMDKTQ
jgi:hypothetical protein